MRYRCLLFDAVVDDLAVTWFFEFATPLSRINPNRLRHCIFRGSLNVVIIEID
jgi:hypothetical protein